MSFGDGEFRFWTEPALRYRAETSNLGSVGDDYPSSPLLPRDHHYSSPSPASRSWAIEQGRRELMEMVRDMQESTFELSLKDMVDEQQSWKESRKEDGPVGEEVDKIKEEQKSSNKKRKKGSPAGTRKDRRQMSRTSSMETGTFMIKLFFPAFLTSRKKPSKGGSRFKSKVSPRTSIDGLENRDDSESWSQQSTAAADQGIHQKHGSSKSSGRSSTCKGESLPSCWPFEMVKGKMRRQRTCNF